MLNIRKATSTDHHEVWGLIQEIIETADTYLFLPNSSKKEVIDYWFDNNKYTYVVEYNTQIVGTFIIANNQPGLGSHVANASFMVGKDFRGKGIGMRMGEFALEEAKRLGYKAMQFNMVVASNMYAIILWKKLGFKIIAELPEAFYYKQKEYRNAFVMYKKL